MKSLKELNPRLLITIRLLKQLIRTLLSRRRRNESSIIIFLDHLLKDAGVKVMNRDNKYNLK
jgi:hypothetical protein